jgi:hypothetical protein
LAIDKLKIVVDYIIKLALSDLENKIW